MPSTDIWWPGLDFTGTGLKYRFGTNGLNCFLSLQVLQLFTVNPLNIAFLNHSDLPQDLINYYTQLVYQQDSNFNPLLWVKHAETCHPHSLPIHVPDVVFLFPWVTAVLIFFSGSLYCVVASLPVKHSLNWAQKKVWLLCIASPSSVQTWTHRYRSHINRFVTGPVFWTDDPFYFRVVSDFVARKPLFCND